MINFFYFLTICLDMEDAWVIPEITIISSFFFLRCCIFTVAVCSDGSLEVGVIVEDTVVMSIHTTYFDARISYKSFSICSKWLYTDSMVISFYNWLIMKGAFIRTFISTIVMILMRNKNL